MPVSTLRCGSAEGSLIASLPTFALLGWSNR
jgi:hypothetical protein